jgi:geranylgeranyl reductase
MTDHDVIVIGGGPAGATAANDLAQAGYRVLLVDRNGRTKPCGGAIPPRAIRDFDIPDEMLVARINCARMISPKDRRVDIPIENGFVGMVDRHSFDEWLRARAAHHGATRRVGQFDRIEEIESEGPGQPPAVRVHLTLKEGRGGEPGEKTSVTARMVIGADGARSAVAQQAVPGADRGRFVFAYHEILEAPQAGHPNYQPERCDVIYDGRISPDFYGWVFPHGRLVSVGTGSMDKGFSLRSATAALRTMAGLADATTVRREGAPIPLKPLPRWDNGRNVVLAGDASGVVAPASGEGIYYAMLGGRLAAESCIAAMASGDSRALAGARKRFMKEHGRVFFVLGILQRFWYSNDKRREAFVKICQDKDVQQLTFDAYMNKRLVRKKPMAHVRIFLKDMAHLLGFAKA